MTLADITTRLVDWEMRDPGSFDWAQAGARRSDREHSQDAARTHVLTRNSMLDELSRWRLRSLNVSIELLNEFLENCHDKIIAERIGLAVLDVAKEFPAKM